MGNDGNFGGNWPPVSKPLPFVIGLSHLSPLLLEFGEYPDLEARFGFRGRMPGGRDTVRLELLASLRVR